MNFPRKVIILGYEYKIDYVPTNREVDTHLDSDGLLGQVSYSNDKHHIRVNASQTAIGVLDTLIHEILHSLLQRNTLLRASIKSEVGEEAFVDTLACEVAYLLVSNGWIELPENVPVTEKRINEV